jgi:hypothetical protein
MRTGGWPSSVPGVSGTADGFDTNIRGWGPAGGKSPGTTRRPGGLEGSPLYPVFFSFWTPDAGARTLGAGNK